MGNDADAVATELAELAGSTFANGELESTMQQLQKLKLDREQDPKVLHNIALTEFMQGGAKEPRALLVQLEKLKRRVDEARAETESGNGSAVSEQIGLDASLITYNQAVVLYQLKQYARCRSILEEMFSNIEPVDEFLAFKACFLLLDVQLLQKQTDKAAEVLSYLERSYATLTKAEVTKENGADAADASRDWPNKHSVGTPPTDITPDDVRSALNLYKAKLSLMAMSPKSSKREIKTTLNACAPNTTGLFLKSNLEYLRQNYRKAIKLLSNSCQKNDRDPNVAALYFNNMGCIHHCMRRHHAAAFYFTRALQENAKLKAADGGGGIPLAQFSCDRRCEIEYNRGLQLLLSGRPEEAFSSFQVASLLLHRQPRLWLRLGEACMAVELQAQAARGEGTLRASPAQVGSTMGWMVRSSEARTAPARAEGASTLEDAPATAKPATSGTVGSPAAPAPTMAYGAKCFRNALFLCEAARAASGHGDYASLTAANAQGSLTLSEEQALQLYTVERLALLQLSWGALIAEDPVMALNWADELLSAEGCQSNLKVYAHLYACDALCQLSRSAEALLHVEQALELGDTLIGTFSNGAEGSTAEGEVASAHNPYCALAPGQEVGTPAARSVLYSNLATVYVLKGELKQAQAYVHQALTLQPKNQMAMLCLIYLELRAGNTDAALDILKRQRLPPLQSDAT